MEEYKYSSYAAYLSAKPSILNRREVLDWFGGIDCFIEHHKIMIDEAALNKQLAV